MMRGRMTGLLLILGLPLNQEPSVSESFESKAQQLMLMRHVRLSLEKLYTEYSIYGAFLRRLIFILA